MNEIKARYRRSKSIRLCSWSLLIFDGNVSIHRISCRLREGIVDRDNAAGGTDSRERTSAPMERYRFSTGAKALTKRIIRLRLRRVRRRKTGRERQEEKERKLKNREVKEERGVEGTDECESDIDKGLVLQARDRVRVRVLVQRADGRGEYHGADCQDAPGRTNTGGSIAATCPDADASVCQPTADGGVTSTQCDANWSDSRATPAPPPPTTSNWQESSHNIEESAMEMTVPTITHDGEVSFVVGEEITIDHINTLKELQEMLRVKDEKVAELKGLLMQRDAKIRELRKKLDMYRSILPFLSPYGRSLKHRPQGDF
ncbi:hypothetical protein HZH68_010308 [Vespula germanica]|uniref:Uncharacterized protein n=1 Tax=Vespula germanica TaxID=30212 RepID=A0A834JRW5_VESGE|nr:hypothetical protein HZH68_010308 [Vespula germanica]